MTDLGLIAAYGLFLVVISRGYSSLSCTGVSLWWLLLLWSRALERGLSSCGTHILLLRIMWDLPG